MSFRCVALLAVCFSLSFLAQAKDKQKVILPEYVLRAQTVYVTIDPDAGEPLTNPSANSTARNDVEIALQKWRRFRLTNDQQNADLIILVRKGQGPADGTVIKGGPVDDRPVILQPQDGGIRVGVEKGRPPGQNGPGSTSSDSSPRIGAQKAPPEDLFEVYQGGKDSPLDSAPVWRYAAKNGLRSPLVPAVEQFKKVIAEAEKQRKSKP